MYRLLCSSRDCYSRAYSACQASLLSQGEIPDPALANSQAEAAAPYGIFWSQLCLTLVGCDKLARVNGTRRERLTPCVSQVDPQYT
jgi:hypothetical protein